MLRLLISALLVFAAWKGYGEYQSRGAVMPANTLFEALGGAAGVLRLARAWHERVMEDEIVAHAFGHGFHPQHTERLAAYWGEAWGGPLTYSEEYGNESSVVRMHSGNGPHEEMDHRAIECFDSAMDDVKLFDPALRRVLHEYFAWATTTTMSSYPDSAEDVPGNLTIPKWSWDGLQR
jgi:hemoglobin